ncbi:zinc finger, CCHC-type containing protein [Tanacetum coccineum]|uniref:Zinc finger, CCHC-type containing protein n=1 Tax=Tanacetum coccineum TaxID=301880 RepID=A0ABQ5GKP5_9ASTR
MGSRRSKEDDVNRISISIYVTNFPENFSAKELFQSCKQYGHVVDSFIPRKRTKEGKRFGFVRFINVFNVDRLVNNLCTIWVGQFKLHANKARFQRATLNKGQGADHKKMALPAQNINHSAFRSMFDNEKLSGTNFNDWFARLKLVLRVEKKMHIIEQPLPPLPAPISEPNVVVEWTKQYDAHTEIACLMLGSMTPELHRQFELYYPYDMIQELRSMFEKQAGVEKFDLIQTFHACKQD